MKVFIHFATLLTTFALLVLSCEERPGKEGTVTIHGDLEILLPPTQKDTSISFTATAAWTAMAEDAQSLTEALPEKSQPKSRSRQTPTPIRVQPR